MPRRFRASLEGAQHGGKPLLEFFNFAKSAGCEGAQPSIYHLFADMERGTLITAGDVRAVLEQTGMMLDGVSCHCPTWVLGSARYATRGCNPFVPGPLQIPNELSSYDATGLEQWSETVILNTIDLLSELGVKVMPMFWGWFFPPELIAGYPWGFYLPEYYEQGEERFLKLTAKIRKHANQAGIYFCHEIHPGTAAQTADEFLDLVRIADGDKCLAVNFDPSHFWQGESFEDAMRKVGDRIYACHVKDHQVIPGRPLRSREVDWKKRGMQFTVIGDGQLDMHRYTQCLIESGYPERYITLHGGDTAPLVGEAESAYYSVDETSRLSCQYIANRLCLPFAEGSFEDNMGAKE